LDASAQRQNWKICRSRVQGDFQKIKVKTRKSLDRQSLRVLKDVEELGVELYSTENEEKSSVAERWNRTMKKKCSRISRQTITTNILTFLTILLRDTTTRGTLA